LKKDGWRKRRDPDLPLSIEELIHDDFPFNAKLMAFLTRESLK
jgi:hypothetical protein